MLKSLLDSSTVPLLKQVARFTEHRQEVLAGNIANIDTPGYRMRDLPVEDFQQALEQAIQQRHRPASPGDTASLLQAPATPTTLSPWEENLFPERLFQAEAGLEQDHITFQDANNRSIEHQMMQMTENKLLQQYAIQVMKSQLDQLQMVITERP